MTDLILDYYRESPVSELEDILAKEAEIIIGSCEEGIPRGEDSTQITKAFPLVRLYRFLRDGLGSIRAGRAFTG